MFSLRNISVRSRFLMVMAVVTLSLLGLGAWGFLSSKTGNDTTYRLFEQANAANTEVGNLRESLSNLRRYEAKLERLAAQRPEASEPEPCNRDWAADRLEVWRDLLAQAGAVAPS